MYHRGHRELQDRFETRALADRLQEVTVRTALTGEDAAFIAARDMLFLATADADGHPTCSYKGGDPGFVRVLTPGELAWPDWDGNGMFRSLGNLAVNPHVGLLFVDLGSPRRLRVEGRAALDDDAALVGLWPGAQTAVRCAVDRVFPNCPRYVHRYELVERSAYVPRPEDGPPPRPAWKDRDWARDVLPPRDR